MTEVSGKTVHTSNLSAAEIVELETSLQNDVDGEGTVPKVDKAVPLAASFKLAIYNGLQPAMAKLAEDAADRIRSHGESARRSVVEIGKELREVKVKLGHGFFGKWIEAEFNMTAKTAQNYMNRARMAEKSESVPGLSDTALQLLAAPSADDVRDKIIKTITDDIRAGKPAPKTKAVKEMISKATGKAKVPVNTPINTSPSAACASAKAVTAAISTLPASSSANTSTKSGSAVTTSATNRPPAASTTSSSTEPAIDERAATAAARLVERIRTKFDLATFAKLYDIAGHEVFRNAMVDALKQAASDPALNKQSA
ncbi:MULTISPECIES: DUF3102 domain-containing protein [unclassified Mesorhizobium]|uniref:DUF3102 domain-containing protein n=1 Tax=unclassified Mesorhizobium TaxID=325217 RepID=UPI00167800CC|nr:MULTISPECIES: DUF3102 domain-containing protein [unclassified Mesorhizobium]